MSKVGAAHSLGPVLRRDRDAEPLAHPGGALSRSVERRADHRRHRVDRAAADPAALRRQESRTRSIATLSERPERNGYDIVREYWQAESAGQVRRVHKVRSSAHASCLRSRGRKWLHDGLIAGTRGMPATADAGGAGCGDAHRGQHAGGRHRDQFPPRPDDLRRALREQRLAAGTAQADVEADVGQRGAHRAGHRASARACRTAT